jgi:trigger factor
VKTSVEPLEGNKVKVSVEVDESEFDKAIDAAFKKLAREVRIPGFRPGKAPRKVLEARFGAEVGRGQALQDALPNFYVDAVKEHDVDVIAAPQIEITAGEDEGPVAFEAVVEVRPVVQVPGYGSLRVTIDSPEPSDDEIDAQIERLRNQFSELTEVDREAAAGDFVTIDVEGSQDGEPIDQLQAEDYLYEVGSGGIVPEVDEQLIGAKAGDTLEFSAADPRHVHAHDDDEDDDEEDDDHEHPVLDFVVRVKEVKEKVLPELDDAFASDASEFETLDELKDDLRSRLSNVKKVQAQMSLREKTGEVLAELVEEDVPDALVNTEVSERLNDLSMRLQAQGLDLDTWVAMSGKQPDEIVTELRETAAQAVKVDLALRAVAEAEAIECTDEDLEAEFAQVAERMNLKAKEVRKQFERAEQVPAVRSDIKKRKAFDWLLERVEIVDADGNVIERASLELDTESADDTDDTGDSEIDDAADADTIENENSEDDE